MSFYLCHATVITWCNSLNDKQPFKFKSEFHRSSEITNAFLLRIIISIVTLFITTYNVHFPWIYIFSCIYAFFSRHSYTHTHTHARICKTVIAPNCHSFSISSLLIVACAVRCLCSSTVAFFHSNQPQEHIRVHLMNKTSVSFF